MIIIIIPITILIWLTLAIYALMSYKAVLCIGISSVLVSLVFHAGAYFLSPERGRGEIVMWSSISIPLLFFYAYVAIGIIGMVIRAIQLVKLRNRND